jgi:GTP-binding protein HflX
VGHSARQLGCAQVPQVLVFNKLDALAPGQRPRQASDLFGLEGIAVPRLVVSGRTSAGVPELRRQLALEVNRRNGDAAAELHNPEIHETPA